MKKLDMKTFPENVAKAINEYSIARAKWELFDKTDNETRTEILRDNVFNEEDSGERITSPNADFLMSESDFKNYLKLAYAKNCEKGFDSGNYELNFYPIHKAMFDAEDALIDAIGKEIPEHYTPEVIKAVKQSPKMRDKFFSIFEL